MRKLKAPPTIDDLQRRIAEVSAVNRELLDMNEKLLDISAGWRDVLETLLSAFAAEGNKTAAKALLRLRLARTTTAREARA